MLAILVCGGRDFSDRDLLFTWMARLRPDCVMHGGARGADSLANDIALNDLKTCVLVFPAKWDEYGRAAGPLRNQEMLDSLLKLRGTWDIKVLAMPGGRGTADMIDRARKAGVDVIALNYPLPVHRK